MNIITKLNKLIYFISYSELKKKHKHYIPFSLLLINKRE